MISFRGAKVLNGMFGLVKGALLEDGRSHLRVIMNLIPSKQRAFTTYRVRTATACRHSVLVGDVGRR